MTYEDKALACALPLLLLLTILFVVYAAEIINDKKWVVTCKYPNSLVEEAYYLKFEDEALATKVYEQYKTRGDNLLCVVYQRKR